VTDWNGSSGAEHAAVEIILSPQGQPSQTWFLDDGWVNGMIGVPFTLTEIERNHTRAGAPIIAPAW